MARILVADDEPRICELMEKVLSKRGHEVETFGDGDSAAEAVLASEDGGYDVVLTDLKMPGKSGLELLAIAKRKKPSLPVIMITGSTEPEDRARADALGVYMLLHKPVDLAYLMTIVDSALAGQNPAAPAAAAAPATIPLVRVVEREACLANLIAYCLKKQGLRATPGPSGGEAAVAIVGSPDGVEAAREDAPRAVIVALYPEGAAADAVRALEAGADLALARPFDPEVLFAHVRAALRRQEAAGGLGPQLPRAAGAAAPVSRNRIAAVKS